MITQLKKYELSIFRYLFIVNFLGVVILLLIFSDKLDIISKVVSVVWGAASLLLTSLGWKKKSNELSLEQVLMLPPMKRLNVVILLGLLFIYQQIWFQEIPAKLVFINEHGQGVTEKNILEINNLELIDIENSVATPNLKYGINYISFAGDGMGNYLNMKDTIVVPLFSYIPFLRARPIERRYYCRFKKGIAQFDLNVSNSTIEINPDTVRYPGMSSFTINNFGKTFITDSLPIGKYSYKISHEWYRDISGIFSVNFKEIARPPLRLKPINSGIHLDIDYDYDLGQLELYLDHSYKPDIQLISNPFIPISDFKQYFIELKDLNHFYYYSTYYALSKPGIEYLKCHLTLQPVSFVKFYSTDFAGFDIYIDDKHRGSLDQDIGSILLPVFDGTRKIRISDWERTIKFPVIDNYIEINKSK